MFLLETKPPEVFVLRTCKTRTRRLWGQGGHITIIKNLALFSGENPITGATGRASATARVAVLVNIVHSTECQPRRAKQGLVGRRLRKGSKGAARRERDCSSPSFH
jgi:hypothetical protein